MAVQYTLKIMQCGGGKINRRLFAKLQEMADNVIDTAFDNTHINVWIDSPGGDAHAAYKLILELRSRAEKLRAFIPDFAMSAATLLAIGCDEIYMAPASEMGPLDVQIKHPDRENLTISGLDAAGAMEFVCEAASQLVIRGGKNALVATDLTRTQVLEAFTAFASSLMSPIMAKIDPQLTRRAAFELEVGRLYAAEILNRRNTTPEHTLSPANADELATALVRGFPMHDFIITRELAQELGLPVMFLEDHALGELVRREHRDLMKQRVTVEALKKEELGPTLFDDAGGQPDDNRDETDESAVSSDQTDGTDSGNGGRSNGESAHEDEGRQPIEEQPQTA